MTLSVQSLTKSFGPQTAVNNISFEANEGEILGFLGPNGAGKSTTMKMICGYMKPDEGHIEILGTSVQSSPTEVKKHLGYLPESNPLYLDMYVKEFLLFIGRINKLTKIHSKINDIIHITGLEKEQNKIIRSLSKGYKQRVGIAQAILHDPKLLILDEPTSGLDINQLIEIRQLIKELGKTKTILFSSHIMQEVQAVCSRVIVIKDGKIITSGSIEELSDKHLRQMIVEIEVLYALSDQSLHTLKNIKKIDKISDKKYTIYGYGDTDIRPEIFNLIVQEGNVLLSMNQPKTNLEDIFLNLTKTDKTS